MRNIAVFGAGGLGREVACMIHEINAAGTQEPWNFLGFFDDDANKKSTPQGEILGNIFSLNAFPQELDLVIALGNPKAIQNVRERLKNPRISFPNLIAPSVYFLDKNSCKFGRGNVIFAGTQLSRDVVLGDFNIVLFASTIGHDARFGDGNVIFAGTRISGNVVCGNGNLFGANSVVRQCVKIGNDITLAASSFLLANPQNSSTYIGVPAKKMEF